MIFQKTSVTFHHIEIVFFQVRRKTNNPIKLFITVRWKSCSNVFITFRENVVARFVHTLKYCIAIKVYGKL